MIIQTLMRSNLPECTLGRAGDGLVSCQKDLTVVMIPFERFSSFAKAVDDLYKTIDVPFNLIVIEGNAPESVRASLEARQRKHKNVTIIYSTYQTSVGAAINLAVPHLKTKYAFIIDNDVRLPKDAMKNLMESATRNQYGIVCPQNYVVASPGQRPGDKSEIQSLGIRTCMLISKEAMRRLGKFDETMTAFTTGIDIRMSAEEAGVSIWNDTATRIVLESQSYLWTMDASLHSFQWNEERVSDSLLGLERKWGVYLKKQDYVEWLKDKKKQLSESGNPFFFLSQIFAKIKFLNREKMLLTDFRGSRIPEAA